MDANIYGKSTLITHTKMECSELTSDVVINNRTEELKQDIANVLKNDMSVETIPTDLGLTINVEYTVAAKYVSLESYLRELIQTTRLMDVNQLKRFIHDKLEKLGEL